MIVVHALILFSEIIRFDHTIIYINFFCTDTIVYISVLCTCSVLQIFIGNSYPADGWFVCN